MSDLGTNVRVVGKIAKRNADVSQHYAYPCSWSDVKRCWSSMFGTKPCVETYRSLGPYSSLLHIPPSSPCPLTLEDSATNLESPGRVREEEVLYVLRRLLSHELWPGSLWAAFSESPSKYAMDQPRTLVHLSTLCAQKADVSVL